MTKAGLTKEDFADAWDLYQSASAQYDSEGNKLKEKPQVFFEILYALYDEGIYSIREIDAIANTIYTKKTVRKYKTW